MMERVTFRDEDGQRECEAYAEMDRHELACEAGVEG